MEFADGFMGRQRIWLLASASFTVNRGSYSALSISKPNYTLSGKGRGYNIYKPKDQMTNNYF